MLLRTPCVAGVVGLGELSGGLGGGGGPGQHNTSMFVAQFGGRSDISGSQVLFTRCQCSLGVLEDFACCLSMCRRVFSEFRVKEDPLQSCLGVW